MSNLDQFYTGEYLTESANTVSSSQAYALAVKIVAAMQQGIVKEYKFIKSSGRIYGANGLVLDKNGITLGIPDVRAQYAIGQDLSQCAAAGQNVDDIAEKILERK